MSGTTDEWWTRDPGVDPRDYDFIREHSNDPPGPHDGICFATWNDELLGPFARRADANAALDRKLDELQVQGVDLSADIRMGVIFADPAIYHVPESTGKPND